MISQIGSGWEQQLVLDDHPDVVQLVQLLVQE